MSRGTYEHMLQVSNKKPRLKAIVDDIMNYTPELIDKVRDQPEWIRKHLKHHLHLAQTQVRMATMPALPASQEITDILYPVRKYIGHSQYEIFNGQGFALSIDPDDVFLIINDWELKINSMVVKVTHTEGNYLIDNSELVDSMTITVYNAYLQKMLDRKYYGSGHDVDDRDTEHGYWNAVRIDK